MTGGEIMQSKKSTILYIIIHAICFVSLWFILPLDNHIRYLSQRNFSLIHAYFTNGTAIFFALLLFLIFISRKKVQLRLRKIIDAASCVIYLAISLYIMNTQLVFPKGLFFFAVMLFLSLYGIKEKD